MSSQSLGPLGIKGAVLVLEPTTVQWVESLLRSIHMIMHAFAVSNEILIIHLSFKVRQLENILREQKCMKTRMHFQKKFHPIAKFT